MTQGSLFFSFVVSFVASYILLSVNGLDPLALLTEWVDFVSPPLFGAAIIFMTLIYYLVLGIMFFFLGNIMFKQQQKLLAK